MKFGLRQLPRVSFRRLLGLQLQLWTHTENQISLNNNRCRKLWSLYYYYDTKYFFAHTQSHNELNGKLDDAVKQVLLPIHLLSDLRFFKRNQSIKTFEWKRFIWLKTHNELNLQPLLLSLCVRYKDDRVIFCTLHCDIGIEHAFATRTKYYYWFCA